MKIVMIWQNTLTTVCLSKDYPQHLTNKVQVGTSTLFMLFYLLTLPAVLNPNANPSPNPNGGDTQSRNLYKSTCTRNLTV